MVNFATVAGGQALTQNTEFSVAQNAVFNAGSPRTSTGYVSVWIDLTALQAGDNVEIRVYRAIAGGTLTAEDVASVQTAQIWMRNIHLVQGNWDITIKLTSATGRTIGFEVTQDTNDVNAATIAANAITAATAATDFLTAVGAAVWAVVSEGAETVLHQLRLLRAREVGKATVQDGDGTYTFRDALDTKNRLVMTKAGTARNTSSADGT